jgi:hypothetical protein
VPNRHHPAHPKNKVEKLGVVFVLEKASVNSPHLPRNSPQTHHRNTTSGTTLSAKTPAKTPIHHKTKNTKKSGPATAEPPA